MARHLLLVCLLLAVFAPAQAQAQAQVQVQKDFRLAVASLDRLDPAVGYALSVRREGTLLIAGAGAVFGATVLTGIIDIATQGEPWSGYTFAFGVPAGLGLVVAGLPALLSSRKFLDFYIEAMPPPSEMARLKLIRHWRMDLLKMRRDTGLLGAVFLGASGLVSGIVWGDQVAKDTLGPPGSGLLKYDSSGGLLTMTFLAAAGSGALTALLAHVELAQARNRPHRAYTPVQVGVAPVITPRAEGGPSMGVQGTLVVRF